MFKHASPDHIRECNNKMAHVPEERITGLLGIVRILITVALLLPATAAWVSTFHKVKLEY